MKPSKLRQLLAARTPSAPASAPAPASQPERDTRALLAAIDAGGIPLHPAKLNQIARALGMEVAREAPMEHTIARIRAWLAGSQSTQGKPDPTA